MTQLSVSLNRAIAFIFIMELQEVLLMRCYSSADSFLLLTAHNQQH